MRFCLLLLALCCGCVSQAADTAKPATPDAPSPVLLRWHFIGGQQLAIASKGTKLDVIRAEPASDTLRKSLTEKLAAALTDLLPRSNTPVAAVTRQLLEPLLGDLFDAESIFELKGAAGQPVSWNLAVRLNKEHAGTWETNLWRIAARGGKEPASLKVGDAKGWTSVTPEGGIIHFLKVGDWVVYGRGTEISGWMGTVDALKKGDSEKLPANQWLTLDAGLAELSERLGIQVGMPLPRVSLKMSAKDEYARTEATLKFAEPMPLQLDPWNVPTNTIHDPLVSFTAIRGISGWLQSQPWWQALEIKPAPNQAFVWGQSPVPFHTALAAPMPGASNEIRRASAKAIQLVTQYFGAGFTGGPVYDTNRGALFWQGIPVMVPFVEPAPEPGGNFLHAGFFPISDKGGEPMPAELLQQIQARTNLVYYHWEITEERLKQWHPTLQALSIASPVPDVDLGPAQKWMIAASPQLGNAITEIVQNSPTQFTLTRKSHVGLTAFEIVSLARWIDSAGFPHGEKKSVPPVVKPPGAP